MQEPELQTLSNASFQYFKSIELVSDAQTEDALDVSPAIDLTELNNSKAWKGSLKELRIDTDRQQQPQEDGELTPDNMSSRLVDSAIGMDEAKFGDLKFDKMSSRVSTFAA